MQGKQKRVSYTSFDSTRLILSNSQKWAAEANYKIPDYEQIASLTSTISFAWSQQFQGSLYNQHLLALVDKMQGDE